MSQKYLSAERGGSSPLRVFPFEGKKSPALVSGIACDIVFSVGMPKEDRL